MTTKRRKVLSLFLALILSVSALPISHVTAFALTSGDFEYSVISEDDKTCEITKYTGTDAVLNIPSQLDGYTVTGIGAYAFQEYSSLTDITIPESVTNIGEGAFAYCSSLTRVTIPSSVTNIGYGAFYICDSLEKIEVDANNSAYCSVNGILFNKEQTELICYPAKKSNTSYTIPESVTNIGLGAFCSCTSLTGITIPSSVTSIGSGAFYVCTSLAEITIPDSVMSMGEYTFSGCTSLTSVTILDGVTDINYGTFEGCTSLTSITIPNSVASIGEYAFRGCTSLTSITIPNSVASIGEYAFRGCTSLASVTIPNSVTYIDSNTFSGCTSLASVTIPDSVTHIDTNTFSGCTSLTSVIIPDSVTYIGWSAFSGCEVIKILGFDNSAAKTYAEENSVAFYLMGDIDGNGAYESNDYSMLAAQAKYKTVNTSAPREVGDINLDGAVDAFDTIQLDLFLNNITDIHGNKTA